MGPSDITPSTVNNTQVCASIDDFRNQVYSTVYSIITVLGLMGNGFALYVLLRTYRQKSSFHIYMLNLAVSDLLCVSTLPLRVLYYVNKGQWNLGDFLCRLSSYALYVNLYCSVFFMMAMSFTRFLAIVFPVQNLRLATEKKAWIVCVCIWVFICTTSSPFLLSGQHTDPKSNKTKCFEPPETPKSLDKLIMLNYFSLVVGFIIPFLVILLCYAGILRTLLRNTNSANKQRYTRNKAIRMIVVVMLAFLVSFMPYHVQRTVHLHFKNRENANCKDTIYMQKSVVITLCLAAANSCFDPMLYFFSGENFRHRLSTFRRVSGNFIGTRKGCRAVQSSPPVEESELQNCNGSDKLG
ncbi:cysteinyl leukotriene receptor 1-like [Carassius auratus]|uniref:Cysteinyl leukotriene receptor 1 n=1 Tax=Carassius auratus TaxID=7957 RepID=A0A6P6QPW0_CARAU|nr:cysteinyl leukotriene receptor 1-like [Carassius auratus]XP_052470040.1 cysteinyl leukotriene receptor 1 [Carassius gibelio]